MPKIFLAVLPHQAGIIITTEFSVSESVLKENQ
jgi:hypothetical protein